MARISHYMAHDPVANIEGVVTDFNPEALSLAAENGIIFIAVDENGAREVVDAASVKEPKLVDECYVFVQPQYVDERTAATVAVFDALSAIVDPQPATADETGEEAESVDPVEAFKAALAALKALEVTE